MIKTRRRALAGKIEATEGTAEILTATEGGIIALDVKWTPDIKMIQRNAALPTLSKIKQIPGLALAHVAFKTELMGRTAAFSTVNLPFVDPYLRAAGFAATLVVTPGAETVTYKPASTGIPSLTLGVYVDGVRKLISGARGTVKFSGTVGEQLFAEFDFMGSYNAVFDTPLIIPTLPTHTPPQLTNAQFTIGAFAPTIKSISFDMGNKLAPREDINAVSGYKSFMLTDRDPSGTFDPEMELVNGHDWYGLWKSGTSAALSLGAIGASQYNKVKITAPTVVTTKVSEGEREGNEVADTSFQLAMGTGDDELVIVFS
ncbi:MAG TPA: hypothetical protein HPP94_08635 [Desulfuromonadales bacterium]|nr:hypothetical protein [Desulfuromonadales bacterium]